MKTFLLFLLLCFLLVIAGACVGFGYARGTKILQRRFFGDELVFVGKDPQGNDFFLQAQLSRAQLPLVGSFTHYYDISLIYRGVNHSVYAQELRRPADVAPLGPLVAYQRRRNPDLSAREELSLTIAIDGISAAIELRGLEGDFLVKNSLEYTKYVSAGDATVTVDGVSFPVDGAITTAYSFDYAPLVFFPGYETLSSETHVLEAWDDDHNFYLLDTSRVEHPTAGYMPHTWVLMKDHRSGSRRRAFAAEAVFNGGREEPVEWSVRVAELSGLELSVREFARKSDRDGEGLVQGTVSLEHRPTRPLTGLFLHHLHGGGA